MSDDFTGSKLMLYSLQKVVKVDIPDVYVEWLALARSAWTMDDLWFFNDSNMTEVLGLWRWRLLMHMETTVCVVHV